MMMRLFIVSKLYASASRTSLSHRHHRIFSGCLTSLSDMAPPLQDNGRIDTWLMNMQKTRCYMSTQADPLNDITSYDESNHQSAEGGDAIRIKVISNEHIKPTSPTPESLRYFKLSMLDQLQFPTYHPFMFFYQNHDKDKKQVEEIIQERSNHLKQSLSETLTQFYPLAGTVASDLHVDCNDKGVYYVETRIDDRLENVLNKKPDNKLLHRLIPIVPNQTSLVDYVSMVQVNFFNCGSFAVTVQNSHKLLDGCSSITFLNAWAAIARRDPNPVKPSFLPMSMFTQNPSLPFAPYFPLWCLTVSPAYLKHGKCATNRFVFDAPALKELKARASKHMPVTRVIAILALLWKCITVETQSKPSILHLPVNIRPRCSPPLPATLVGNPILSTSAGFDPETIDLELAPMASLVKKAVANVNIESIEELAGEDGYVRLVETARNSMEILSDFKKEYYLTSSMCNSGTNKADFGWGKPVWACTGNVNEDVPLFMNRMILFDSCSGDGIEVWVTLEKQIMDAVKCNRELLSFASVDPSPLQLKS